MAPLRCPKVGTCILVDVAGLTVRVCLISMASSLRVLWLAAVMAAWMMPIYTAKL